MDHTKMAGSNKGFEIEIDVFEYLIRNSEFIPKLQLKLSKKV